MKCASARRTAGACAAIAGLYYEDNALYDQTGWHYKSIPPCTSNGDPGTPGNTGCVSDVGTFPGTTVQNPGVQNDNTSFYQDQLRTTRQIAEYFSTSYDLVPHALTLTAGVAPFLLPQLGGRQRALELRLLPGGHAARRLPVRLEHQPQFARTSPIPKTGDKVRANLTWHIRQDLMLYYTFSQGFRPGGFNQNGGAAHGIGADGVAQYLVPRSYTSDNLTNNEIGWKTELLDHRLQWNGAVYYDNWTNVQVEFFNPGVVGNIFYDTNGQDFLIKGIETSLVARVMTGLTVQGAADWNKSGQTNSPALIDNNPADTANFGKPITQVCSGGACSSVSNPFGPIGAPSANSPPMQFSLRARYDWLINDYVPLRPDRHQAHRSFVLAGGRESRDRRRRLDHHFPRALRESRLLDARCGHRCLQRQLARRPARREPHEFQRQHVHQHRPVHHRADAAAAAGHRALVRLQFRVGRAGSRARAGAGSAVRAVTHGGA